MEGKLSQDSQLPIRERIKGIKNPTNEDLIELWEENIKLVLEKGNLFSGHGDRIQVLSEKFTLEEKVLHCLIRLYSIKEGYHYNVSYPSDKRPSLKIFYTEGDQVKERDVKDLVEEASRRVQEFKNKKPKPSV